MAGKDDGEGDCANRAVAKTPGDHDHNDGGGEEEGKMTLEVRAGLRREAEYVVARQLQVVHGRAIIGGTDDTTWATVTERMDAIQRNVAAGRRLMEEAHLRNVWIEDAMRMEEREGHGRAVVLRWLSNEEVSDSTCMR